MNRRQKLVQQRFLNNEEEVIKELKKTYTTALDDIKNNIKNLNLEIDSIQGAIDVWEDFGGDEEKEILQSQLRSKIYQKQYQEALQGQIDGVLDKMNTEQFDTVSGYLKTCYDDGYIGTLYDLQGQGVPLVMPIDQESVARAVQLDSKISQGLYNRMGEDVTGLKKVVASEVSRGIATGMTYEQVARNISHKMVGTGYKEGGAMASAMRIARTEGHRIQCQAGMDACYKARDMGADVAKKWDSTLDGKTRSSHRQVDGEIRELDDKFSNGLMFPGDPSGRAAEVVNCRCSLLQKARWLLEGAFTKMNNFTKEIETFNSPEEYEEFKKAFWSKENRDFMNYHTTLEDRYGTKNFEKLLGNMTDDEYKHWQKLYNNSPVYNKAAKTVETKKIYEQNAEQLTYFTRSNIIQSEIHENPILSSEQTVAKAKEIAEELENSTEVFTPTKIFEVVQNKTGNDGLPKVVSSEEFEKISKDKTKLYRGYHDDESGQKTVDDMIDEFKYGKLHCGNSGGAAYGRGVYFTPDESIATGEYAYNGGKVITAVLDDSAKIADFNELTDEYLKTGIPKNFGADKESYEYVIGDLGSYAAIKGYDGIALNGYQDKQHYIILNRTKMIIRE